MKSGVLREDEGFDIIINRVNRTFRDLKEHAYEAARFAKGNNPEDRVEIRDRSTGTVVEMRADGRTG
jgi:hypothetical protein